MSCSFPFWVVLLAIILTTNASNLVKQHYLTLHHNVSQPVGLVQCTNTLQRFRWSCVHSCAASSTCASAYTIWNDTIGGDWHWECTHCENAIRSGSYAPGNGYYALFKIENGLSTPTLPNAIFKKFEHAHGLKAAHFDCQIAGNYVIRMVLDQKDDTMPDISDPCLNTICQQEFLSWCLFKVSSDGTGFVFMPICNEGETRYGFHHCQSGGLWTAHDQIGIPCVSPTCRRISANRVYYKGHLATTRNGVACQRWDSQYPHNHDYVQSWFSEDYYSHANAVNYCRDPDGYGSLWCYTMDSGKRWDYCDVPLCAD